MARPELSLVLVTYHSSPVLATCMTSFRHQAEHLGRSLEIIIVDHSECEQEHQALAGAGADRCLLRPNRGYAAGINAGAAASSGRVLLLANPDIELLPGSLAALLATIEQGATVVGPTLVWDAEGRVLLPIPEDPAPGAELWRTACQGLAMCWRRGLPAQLQRCRRLWTSDQALPVPSLRGPLLVLSRDSWQRLGNMDEGYFLYYEETDWLWRARRQGASLAMVGPARVVHRWGHATERCGDREGIEQQSRQRFLQRFYPAALRWLLTRLERLPQVHPIAAEEIGGPDELPRVAADLWLVSPFSHLLPAAGWLGGEQRPPRELARLTGSGRWYALAAVRLDKGWTMQGCWSWGGQ